MPYIITEPCIDILDGACRAICPVNCIYLPEETLLPVSRQRQKMYVNPAECIDCDACRDACPVDAIFDENEVPEMWQAYIAEEYAAFGLSRSNKETPW